MIGKKAVPHPFLRGMTQGTADLLTLHLNTGKHHGADPPGIYAEAFRRVGEGMGQLAWLHQGQVLPDQPNGFL